MPKKNPGMTPAQQSERFKADVQKLIDAGELNPTEADAAFERAVKAAANPPSLRRESGA